MAKPHYMTPKSHIVSILFTLIFEAGLYPCLDPFTLVHWLIHPPSSMLTGQLGLTLFIIVPMTPTISISHCQCLAARPAGRHMFRRSGDQRGVFLRPQRSARGGESGKSWKMFWFPHGR